MAKKKNLILKFILVGLGFGAAWAIIINPLFLNLFATHPNLPIPLWWVLKESVYAATIFIASLFFFKNTEFSLRFSIGAVVLLSVFLLIVPPICISPKGDLLITADNASCRSGDDTFISWIGNHIGIQYGTKTMYYFTYIAGVLIYGAAAALLLNKKELLGELKNALQ